MTLVKLHGTTTFKMLKYPAYTSYPNTMKELTLSLANTLPALSA